MDMRKKMRNTSCICNWKKKPLSIYINTFGTGTKTNEELVKLIQEKFDLTPNGIIEYLGLKIQYII